MRLSREKGQRWLSLFLFVTLIASIAFTVVRIVNAPTILPEGGDARYDKTKSDYALMFIQCGLGVIVMLLPGWRSKSSLASLGITNCPFSPIFTIHACFPSGTLI